MIEYRRAEPNDVEAIARLHTRSWRENYRGSFTDAFLDGDLLAERLAVWRARFDEPAPNQFVEVAVVDGDLVGFVCVYGDEDAQWGSFVDNLHVSPDAKRGGVGSTLMRRAGAWLDTVHPEPGIYLWVLASNASARRFYERIGASNAETTRMETHGGAMVQSCRYVWPNPRVLAGDGARA